MPSQISRAGERTELVGKRRLVMTVMVMMMVMLMAIAVMARSDS